jgi:hypothetical protein
MMKQERGRNPRTMRGGTLLLVVLLVGLAIRILYIAQLHGSDLWGLLSLDARLYGDLARVVASRLSLPDGVITYNPLYPVFLGILFRTFGESLLAARMIQSVLGLFMVWLLYEAGCRLSARGSGRNVRAGLIAASMAVLYAQFLLFEGSLLTTSLVTLLLTASVTMLLVIDEGIERGKPLSGPAQLPFVAFGVGAMLGAGVMGRPNLFLLLVPAVPLWMGLRHRKWLPAAMCLLGSVLLMLPLTIHNGAATGRFIPLPAHGGINLYVGNGPDADGTFNPPPGMRASMEGYVADARLRAEELSGRAMTDGEASRYWTGEAVDAARADWPRWFALLGRKIMLFWNGAEISDVIDLSFYREVSWALRLPIIPFSLISALALVGFVVLWREAKRRSVILIFSGAGLFSILPFFVNTRYRMPVVPVLILVAAFLVSWVFDLLRDHRWRPAAAAGAACVLLLSMTARPMVAVNRSAGYTFLGNYHLEQGHQEKALGAFETAHRLDPDRVETAVNYARILRMRGDYGLALPLYEKAYRLWPDFPMLAVEYGSLLDERGEREEAKELLRYALSLGRNRDGIIACKLLSRIALEEGRREEAEYYVRRALEIAPGDESLVEMLDWLGSLEQNELEE